ncbi:MAG: beta-propeller domain-containing protein [Propionibacteriaceae bacterium]|nr:beta-propeller domain-containing protein [Propionibacteriaceae bacterium]
MNDDIFSEIAGQLRPDPQVRARLLEALDAEPAAPPPALRLRRWLPRVAAAAAVAMVGLAILPTLIPGDRDLTDPPVPLAPGSGAAVDPGDYAQAYAAVQKAFAATPQREYEVWGEAAVAADGRSADLQFAQSTATEDGGTWTTNTQVVGIDEGDIVKSDGRTIFTASGNDVVLVSAEGADTTEVARIDTTAQETGPTAGTVQGPVIDLMLHGDSLVVLVTEYTPRLSGLPASESMTYVPYDASRTRALLYDVSDPTSPRFVTGLGQSGAYATSRLAGDLLYLVTDYAVGDRDAVDPDDPATFVPSVADAMGVAPVAAADLSIPASPTGPMFQVISSIDLSSGQRIDTASVMGRADITYMGDDNLFLASTTYQSTAASEFTLDQDSGLRDVAQKTDVVRIELADGGITVAASASIPGMPLNQFALDHFDGHLRVAVTMDGTTAAGGWATYPTVFVLDDALGVVGSLPQLAVNEQIQSVRFQGPLAYVVSYRQIDPLFALDLSIPADPKVMSALKIPGFSTYLHPWAEGRLLGLGVDASEDGQILGMKLSMFDTADPFDVTEATTIKVPFHDAEALRNHKAVFVDPDRGLIGFAVATHDNAGKANTDYLLYGYDETMGFTLLGELPVQQSPTNQAATARAMTIDADLYVVAPAGVDVYTTDSLTQIASHQFIDG